MSPARFEILQVLAVSKSPLRLRTIAQLTQVSLRPVQVALPQLLALGFIKKVRSAGQVFYQIDELPSALHIFIKEIERDKISAAHRRIASDARSLGPFQEDAYRMVTKRQK